MPATIELDIETGKPVRIWNTAVRVGKNGYHRGMDVKLCQYLMSHIYKENGFTITDVTGVWTPKTAAILARLEKKNEVVADGCIDPMKNKSGIGKISKKVYKIFLLQQGYIQNKTGKDMGGLLVSGTFTQDDIQDLLMNMPEENADMPSDLKWALVNARDGGSLEF